MPRHQGCRTLARALVKYLQGREWQPRPLASTGIASSRHHGLPLRQLATVWRGVLTAFFG
jgi:hypothetical protein